MTRVNITQLRQNLREAVEQVKAGEEIEVVQNGVVVAALVHPARLRPRVVTPNTLAAQTLWQEIQAERQLILEGGQTHLGQLPPEAAQSLLEEVKWHREESE